MMILTNWHQHKLTYSVLSIMARDILIVPVSTISSYYDWQDHQGTEEEAEVRDGGDAHLHQGLAGGRGKAATQCGGQRA